MGTVYLLMSASFGYSDDFFLVEGQEPRRAYLSQEAAQAQCDALNVRRWHNLKVADYWPYGPVPPDPWPVTKLSTPSHNPLASNIFEEEAILPDDNLHALKMPSEEREDRFVPQVWEEGAENFPIEEAAVIDDFYGEAGDNADFYFVEAELDARAPEEDFPLIEEKEQEYDHESERPRNYSLETLHAKLTAILGDKVGAPWTNSMQWESWRVPVITAKEASALARVFNLTFYSVVEVELE